MSKPDTAHHHQCPVRQATKASAETRVDAAHVVNREVEATAAPAEVLSDEAVAEQLRTQAAQLAAHLRGRQKELDHREAQINAGLAHLEGDTRAARLWLAEREAELNRRDEELPDRRPTEAGLRYERQQIQAQREALERLNRQLLAGVERRRRAVEARAAKLQQEAGQPTAQLLAREEVLRRTAEALQARQRRLEEAEARLADTRAETEELHRRLCEARREAREESRIQRQRLAAEQRQGKAELERQRQAVHRRSEQVDQSKAALEQLRTELGRMHRETLEIRLATEELWAQLSGAAPPAALTRSLGRIRTKLADHYRLSNAELHRQKEELEGIRRQLAERYEKLVQQKREFEQWAARRQKETEQQAARLIAREEQLAEKEAKLKDRAHRWQAERLDHQHQIRHLQAKVAAAKGPAVPA